MLRTKDALDEDVLEEEGVVADAGVAICGGVVFY